MIPSQRETSPHLYVEKQPVPQPVVTPAVTPAVEEVPEWAKKGKGNDRK